LISRRASSRAPLLTGRRRWRAGPPAFAFDGGGRNRDGSRECEHAAAPPRLRWNMRLVSV
jgi:hypothetical protein